MALHAERRDWHRTAASPPLGTERWSREERTPSSLRGLVGARFPPKRRSCCRNAAPADINACREGVPAFCSSARGGWVRKSRPCSP
ncbi:unnamed protein product [Lampetra fluviatilis]